MEEVYTYIGAINPPFPADNFAISLFTWEEDYFIQNANESKISSFKKINIPNLIRRTEDVIKVKVGDDYIYSYLTHTNELYYGNREIIETPLIKLIKRDDINAHSKLLISSFLQFYTQTLNYLEAANNDLEKNGVKTKITEEATFKKEKRPVDLKFYFFDLISNRFEKLHEIDPSIKLEDIAIINNDKAYFQDFFFEFADFMNKENLSRTKFKNILTKIITSSYSQKRVDLEKLISTNNDSYEFLLESDNIIFEQQDLEKLLTTEIEKAEESIIDIGLQVDKELYENTNRDTKKISKESKNLIIESFTTITGVKPATINNW